ncbi:MAG: thioesterase family protein [Elusimicrobiota bacterium]
MKFSDRRLKPRIAVDFPVALEHINEQAVSANKVVAYTVDLSENGCSLFLDHPYNKEDMVNLYLYLPSPYSMVKVEGKVVWEYNLDGEFPSPFKYRCGLQFFPDCPDAAKTLNDYIQEMSKVRSYIDRREAERRRQMANTRRHFDRRTKEFYFEKIVYLAETNNFGNVYFTRYLDWCGMALESFFYEIVPSVQEMKEKGMSLVTVKAAMSYKREAKLFDELLVVVQTKRVREKFLEFFFKVVDQKTNKLIASSKQILAFTDENRKLIPLPEQIKNNLLSLIA